MKKVTTIFILIVLLLTSCANPDSPHDGTSAETPSESESTIASPNDATTTDENNELSTLGEVETTIPEDAESNVPDVLFEVLPEIPSNTGYGWLKSELQKYNAFPKLNEITPIRQGDDKAYRLLPPFSIPHGNFTHNSLKQLQHYSIPIEYITLTDSDHACAIFKIEHATTGEYAYLYQMYKQQVYESGSGIHHQMYEQYLLINEAYWGTNGLKYSDCSVLKPGDSMETVRDLIPHIGWSIGMLTGVNPENYFLLEDGVLYIKLGNIDYSDYFVEEIQFYPNGTDAEINGQELSILKAEKRPPLPGEDD